MSAFKKTTDHWLKYPERSVGRYVYEVEQHLSELEVFALEASILPIFDHEPISEQPALIRVHVEKWLREHA